MKMKFNIGAAAVVSMLMLATGCKKFIDVNDNPNSPTIPRSDWVFTGAEGTTYRTQVGTSHIVPGTWTGFYAHSTSFTGGGNEKVYAFSNTDFDVFSGWYDNLADYQYVIDNAEKDGYPFLIQPANIMQCLIFQVLVDIYGDVPYKEALQGVKDITPAYAKQQDIYEDLVKRLDAAIAAMKAETWPTATEYTRQDVFFALNKANWIRFANTVKLRILMRQSFMPGRDSYITTNINSTVTDGYISATVLCTPGYQVQSGKLNPYYSSYGYNEVNTIQTGHQYRKMNAVIINWLKTTQDMFRLQSLAWPAGTSPTAISNDPNAYVGVPLGVSAGYANANASPQGPIQIVRGEGTRPGIVMTLSEALFLQAEAAERYGIAALGTPQTLYENAIRAHFRLCADPKTTAGNSTIGDPAYNAYMTTNAAIANVSWTASPDKIKAILIQKWVSLCNINGEEAWAEYRKSSGSASVGVPYSVRSQTAPASVPEPVRFYYPLKESNTNGDNVPTMPAQYALNTKIFWDVN
ncbi:MAG: SusD/RagB family nutrient-binding outer membrane lipoprotein [Chitinophagaceae bacterium]|jgi:hypothetical protein|nr:MAG: SusD/RagB family nutrient-binding outer membrane lipoprotein [Chitinophagaceae bacterium]